MPRKLTPNPEVGQRFHRLVVLARVEDSKNKWLCVCDCGNQSIARKHHLLNGKHKSCGCLQKEAAKAAKTTHGKSAKAGLYSIWMNIKSRTTNPNVNCFHRYGGRGISMCSEWFNSFEAFSAGVGERPPGMTLDRTNNDGNYEPGNVRWVPHRTNCLNKSDKVVITAFGLPLQLHEWEEITGICRELIRDRVRNRKWFSEDSVATQPGGRRFSRLPPDDLYRTQILETLRARYIPPDSSAQPAVAS